VERLEFVFPGPGIVTEMIVLSRVLLSPERDEASLSGLSPGAKSSADPMVPRIKIAPAKCRSIHRRS
jgi:hypothetical protein